MDAPLLVPTKRTFVTVHVDICAEFIAGSGLRLNGVEFVELRSLFIDVVVNHINQDRAAEQAFLLQQHVDVVKLVTNCVPLLRSQFWTSSTNTSAVHALGLALSREEFLDA